MLRAIWNDQVIAESPTTVSLGGREYFPQEALQWDFVRDSQSRSLSLKGRACYYVLEVDGSTIADAAWYFPRPTPLARKVKGHVAFGDDVKVVGQPET